MKWGRLLLGILIALAVPVVAQLRLLVPVEQTVLFIVPAMAACAFVAWRSGGRLWLALAWGGLAVWMLGGGGAASGAQFDALSRGWVLVLAGAFGISSVVAPRQPFFARALAATGIAVALSGLIVLAGPGRSDDLGRTISGEFSRRLQVVTSDFDARQRLPEVEEFARRFPAASAMVAEGERQLPTIASLGMELFPAMLGLESLALLALAWTLFHRSSRTRIGPALGYLCEFRFNDQLVWGVVLGVTLLVLPGMNDFRSIGLNLVVFFGAMYALRGLGVISWFLAPGRPAPALLVLAAFLAGPVLGVFSVGLGLADTWIDWRGRLRPAT